MSPDTAKPQPVLYPLDLTLMLSLHLSLVQPHQTLQSVPFEPREPRATRFSMASFLMPGSRTTPHLNVGERHAIRVGVPLV
jgi:hypothetical protein